MNDTADTSPPDSPPPHPIGRVETDTFCACGYNLHTLAVFLDQRLGIPLCRCPECGRFHAIGRETSANSLWLTRLGCMMTVLWVLFVLAVLVWGVIGLSSIQYLSLDLTYHLRRPPGRYDDTSFYIAIRRVFHAGGLLAGFVYGAIIATLLWHLNRRSVLAAALPFLAMVVVYYIVAFEDDHWFDFIAAKDFILFAALQAAGIISGILLGRALVRWVLRMFLPPRMLQFLAFLWHVDGKELPISARAPMPGRDAPEPAPAASVAATRWEMERGGMERGRS